MFATVCLALTLGLQGAQFSNPELNFTFTHPKAWKVVTNKKAVSTVTIPIPESRSVATMEIYAVSYRLSSDEWLGMQASVAKNMGHEVVRQWTEDLLNVPLLLTRTQMAGSSGDQTVMQGMLYSATTRKLLFRLVAPTAVFAQAEAEWRALWPSMRTVDGTLPVREDPARTVEPVEPNKLPVFRPSPVVVISKVGVNGEAELGLVAIDCQAAGRTLKLHVPEGWSGVRREDGVIVLSHALLPTPLEVTVLSTLDSDLPARALFRLSAKSLDRYKTVATREEPVARPNKAGALVSFVLRSGQSADGPLRTLDAVGHTGEFYWSFTRAWPGTPDAVARELVLALAQAMSVELVP